MSQSTPRLAAPIRAVVVALMVAAAVVGSVVSVQLLTRGGLLTVAGLVFLAVGGFIAYATVTAAASDRRAPGGPPVYDLDVQGEEAAR